MSLLQRPVKGPELLQRAQNAGPEHQLRTHQQSKQNQITK